MVSVKTIIWNGQVTKETITCENELYILCDYLSKRIINELSHRIIHYIIEYEYFYFQPSEQTFIEDDAKKEFNNSDKRLIYKYLSKELFKYLSENRYINIQGFLTFRAEQFIEYLHLTIDDVISRYLVEIETNELVDYLKQYLNNQEPIVESIYIVLENDNQYSILNEMFEPVVLINKHDELLLNTIINIAPKYISVYGNIKNMHLKKVLEQIFENCISFYDYAYNINDI